MEQTKQQKYPQSLMNCRKLPNFNKGDAYYLSANLVFS
jgi:hypothetical protein